MASPEIEENVPALVRVGLPNIVRGIVQDELGNALSVSLVEVAYHGDEGYSVTLLVAGTVAIGVGPIEAADLSVPFIVSIDPDAEQALDWEADLPAAEVSLR